MPQHPPHLDDTPTRASVAHALAAGPDAEGIVRIACAVLEHGDPGLAAEVLDLFRAIPKPFENRHLSYFQWRGEPCAEAGALLAEIFLPPSLTPVVAFRRLLVAFGDDGTPDQASGLASVALHFSQASPTCTLREGVDLIDTRVGSWASFPPGPISLAIDGFVGQVVPPESWPACDAFGPFLMITLAYACVGSATTIAMLRNAGAFDVQARGRARVCSLHDAHAVIASLPDTACFRAMNQVGRVHAMEQALLSVFTPYSQLPRSCAF